MLTIECLVSHQKDILKFGLIKILQIIIQDFLEEHLIQPYKIQQDSWKENINIH